MSGDLSHAAVTRDSVLLVALPHEMLLLAVFAALGLL